ncbi:MAG: 4Fe-4S ferredoxin, partial [Cellulosilyticum sp.]|nr:4Fe-4S ferredoxin [Cellulosilyticum sp.]
PCLSKKIEGMEEECIDAVLTFEEFVEWMKESGLSLKEQSVIPFDGIEERQRLYPIVGGVTATIAKEAETREIITIDGIGTCQKMMPHIIAGEFKHCLLEMHGCRYGCIAGPGMPRDGVHIFERQARVKQYAKGLSDESPRNEINKAFKKDGDTINLHKVFPNLQKALKMPSEAEIIAILNQIGKETPLDELNCGSCGYKTCREKAIAVYNGLAEPYMCLPYMRQQAETLTNVIFEATPNMIVMINENLEILEMNPAAKQFFKVTKEQYTQFPIGAFLDEALFETVKETRQNLLNLKVQIETNDTTVIQSIIWSEYHHMLLWIASDMTQDEKQAKKLQSMKIEAIDMAQQVINKQMTVAQEIASLLGETTAETKVTLTKLKNLIQEEEAIKS